MPLAGQNIWSAGPSRVWFCGLGQPIVCHWLCQCFPVKKSTLAKPVARCMMKTDQADKYPCEPRSVNRKVPFRIQLSAEGGISTRNFERASCWFGPVGAAEGSHGREPVDSVESRSSEPR